MKNYALRVRYNGEHVYLKSENGSIFKAGIDEIIRLKNSYPASIIVRLRKRRNKKTNVVSKVGRNGNRRAS